MHATEGFSISFDGLPQAVKERFMEIKELKFEDLPHIPRIIIGAVSEKAIDAGLNVLSGEYPAKGSLTCDVKLQ